MPRFRKLRVHVLSSTTRLDEVFLSSRNLCLRVRHVLEILLTALLVIAAVLTNILYHAPVLDVVTISATVLAGLYTVGDVVMANMSRGLLTLRTLLEIVFVTKTRSPVVISKQYRIGDTQFTLVVPVSLLSVTRNSGR